MYNIVFPGGDGVAYIGKAKNKTELRKRTNQLRRMRIPVIVILWDNAPIALMTRSRSGKYRVRDWD